MTHHRLLSLLATCLITTSNLAAAPARAKAAAPEAPAGLTADAVSGLELRGIGPALTSGRIGDIAVDPTDPKRRVVAVASGGVWVTGNAGITWKPVFDSQGSYSIGCVTLDPRNPNVIWVGTGENNSQRSVGYGDGVYRSRDGGATWENLGLKASEHIGMIAVDPRDSKVVYVAAQGPLWAAGGDRGLYKTTDGGATWKAVLAISENTGVSEVHLDPRNPDTLLAVAYQRRRHVWTLIDGGPESAIHKSTDGGATWRKVGKGLPEVDLGRIGIDVSPANPDVVYAVVEAADGKSGFYRSANRGETWEKRSDYVSSSPQYYQELVADPNDPDRVYSLDTYMQVSEDGGKTFAPVGNRARHVDDHALWIDPADTAHLLVGGDGGLYESFDRGATWRFQENLPVTQFYRVAVDEARPFYTVYGGTQDNMTLGGPSRTLTIHGIANQDWYAVVGGDGFWAAIDPEDPNIVYAESQHAGIVRFDRRSGEKVGIRPQERPGEDPLRFNWDSPLLISPHSHTRLYLAAQRLFRSDDRGDTWKPVSGDLTRSDDRNTLPVMGKVWGPDAVAKNASTSFYGNIVALAESPSAEGVLYVGTDDGLVQVSEDGGGSWRAVGSLPGVPDRAYVSDLCASQHDAGVVYAALDNHKMGDFKPYLLKSADRGRTWASVAGDLPARGSVYAVAEDHVDPRLLFAGTEFGAFFSADGGAHWVQLKGGMPVIAVKDIAVQKRENDLVLATFGRGFYVLDNYTPLRGLKKETLEREATLFPARDALLYVPARPLELRGKSFMGETFFTAPNPPFGAVLTFHLEDKVRSRKELRQEREKEAAKKGETVPYPTLDELRAEAEEDAPEVYVTVTDTAGAVVRRVTGDRGKGFHRVAWDLRYPPSTPTEAKPWDPDADENLFSDPAVGPLVKPGPYRATLAKRVGGVETVLAGPVDVSVVALQNATLAAPDRAALVAFQHQAASLQRAATGALRAAQEADKRLDMIKLALADTPAAPTQLRADADALAARLDAILRALRGDRALARRNVPVPTAIVERAQSVVDDGFASTAAPTQTQRDAYTIASAALAGEIAKLRALVATDLAALERSAEAAGAPWTPGRLPEWEHE